MIRSPYDHSSPSPSEEMLGIYHGVAAGEIDPIECQKFLAYWLGRHFRDDELERITKRDEKLISDNTPEYVVSQFCEWGLRVKNGEFLTPLPGMQYKPRIKSV